MKLFERGSVTVFLTLILIPSIIITAVFFDGARIKLYNNQAIMAADSYAEGILTEYDNLLKELYGVFAVTQDDKGKAAIGEIRDYIKTSFNPAGNTINNQYDPGFFHKKIDGFMPYKDAKIEVGTDAEPYFETIDGANLGNPKVLGTQIGDFMRYRIVKDILDSDNSIIGAVGKLKEVEADSEAGKKMNDVMNKAQEIVGKQDEFYKIVSGLDIEYVKYLKALNGSVDLSRQGKKDTIQHLYDSNLMTAKAANHPFKAANHTSNAVFRRDKNYLYTKGIIDLVTSEDYEKCFPLKTDTDVNSDSTQNSDSDTSNTLSGIDRSNSSTTADNKPDKKQIEDEFNWYVDLFKDVFMAKEFKGKYYESFKFRIDNYDEHVKNLTDLANEIKKNFGQFETIITELNTYIEKPEISETMKTNIKDTLEMYKKLSKYKPETYIETAKYFVLQKFTNSYYNSISIDNLDYFKQLERYYFLDRSNNGKNDSIENGFKKYQAPNNAKLMDIPYENGKQSDKQFKFKLMNEAPEDCRELYSEMKKWFKNSEKNEDAKKKEKDAKKKQKEAEKEKKKLEKEEKKQMKDLKNIPSSFELNDIKGKGLSGSITDFFNNNAINALFIKTYTISYDLGMFSNRVDKNLTTKEGEEKQTKESITGYDMSKLNYIYGAEQEYLFGGSRISKDNLDKIRNSIFVFREGTNLASTFMIQEVNGPINNLTAALMWAPPIAISVNAISRLAIATAESVADWKLLMAGKKIVLLKAKITDSSIERLIKEKIETDVNKSLKTNMDNMNEEAKKLGEDKAVLKSDNKAGIEIDYSQLVTIMILLFVDLDTLVARTGNLICVNVNNALTDGNMQEQKFKLSKAYTAVKGTCNVKLDYLMLPNGFGGQRGYKDLNIFTQKSIQKDTWDRMKEVEQSDHKFSVIRGY